MTEDAVCPSAWGHGLRKQEPFEMGYIAYDKTLWGVGVGRAGGALPDHSSNVQALPPSPSIHGPNPASPASPGPHFFFIFFLAFLPFWMACNLAAAACCSAFSLRASRLRCTACRRTAAACSS